MFIQTFDMAHAYLRRDSQDRQERLLQELLEIKRKKREAKLALQGQKEGEAADP